jgi:hypothetical protein
MGHTNGLFCKIHVMRYRILMYNKKHINIVSVRGEEFESLPPFQRKHGQRHFQARAVFKSLRTRFRLQDYAFFNHYGAFSVENRPAHLAMRGAAG